MVSEGRVPEACNPFREEHRIQFEKATIYGVSIYDVVKDPQSSGGSR
jgi:hypothetical protein